MEGRRRSDLVRFGLYTGSKYLWSFKGGAEKGAGVPSYYNIYPIPDNEIKNNPNMTQNPKILIVRQPDLIKRNQL